MIAKPLMKNWLPYKEM